MAALCQDTGFGYMIAFFINIFNIRTFGTIPDNIESFKFIAIWLYDITVIDMNNRFVRDPFTDRGKIGMQGFYRGAVIQMPCKPFYGIDLFRRFMKLINDIRKKTAAGSEHTISHVSSELSIRFGQVSGNFV